MPTTEPGSEALNLAHGCGLLGVGRTAGWLPFYLKTNDDLPSFVLITFLLVTLLSDSLSPMDFRQHFRRLSTHGREVNLTPPITTGHGLRFPERLKHS